MSKVENRLVSRRRLLGRAAFVGAAGAGLAVAASSGAEAAADEAVTLGTENAGLAPTTVTSSGSAPTLVVGNPSGAPLQLAPEGSTVLPGAGELSVSSTGQFLVANSGTVRHPGALYTDRTALTTVPTPPTRVLDTRNAAGRAHVVYGAADIVNGRLIAGGLILIDLDHLVEVGEGMRANVTVANTASGGYLTVWGVGGQPVTSSLNWYGAGQVLSNTVLAQLGAWADLNGNLLSYNGIWISAVGATAVIVDVAAFIVDVPVQVVSFELPAASAGLSSTNSQSFKAGSVDSTRGPVPTRKTNRSIASVADRTLKAGG